MDVYEATRVVFSRVQNLDPDNANKIMGFLLIQDHGEKEMIRLAFGPESVLQSIVIKARKELCLPSPSSSSSTPPASPSAAPASPFLGRQNSSSRVLPPSPLAASSPSSWAPPPVFSRSDSGSHGAMATGPFDELRSCDEFAIPGNPGGSPFFKGGAGPGDLIDDFHLQDQLPFIKNSMAAAGHKSSAAAGCGELFFSEVECQSPGAGNGDGAFPYGMGWGANSPHHRRSFSAAAAAELYLGNELGWKPPCLYFARGYCKNGSACRFLHALPDEVTTGGIAAVPTAGTMEAIMEQQRHELLLRSKSQRIGGGAAMSQLMASSFLYSPTGSMPASPSSFSSKCLNLLLQQQQNDNQRAATAAAATALMLGGDDGQRFLQRSRLERLERDLNPGSRQIYLTFPADSTFSEEDVANYFSIYGPVQDVRIPYQQKRMFGFVTFVYPETVKLILAKGNPHFVSAARVLVKPYKEKGKIPDKYRKQLQQADRGDFTGCTTPTGLVDSRDSLDLHNLGARMLYGNAGGQELLLRKRIEEQQQQQQQQAMELQQAIELQRSRFMGLQLLDLKNRSLASSVPVSNSSLTSIETPVTTSTSIGSSSQEQSPTEDKSPIASATAPELKLNSFDGLPHCQTEFNKADKEEADHEAICNEDELYYSSEHNLPDSPFDSPTKSSIAPNAISAAETSLNSGSSIRGTSTAQVVANNKSSLFPPTGTLDMASLASCFLQMPRFSSGHGATGI